MTADEIVSAVARHVSGTKYRDWRAGITQKTGDRRAHWGDPPTFVSWIADSLDVAREVEWRLIDKGMQGNEGGVMSALETTHVYIFRV